MKLTYLKLILTMLLSFAGGVASFAQLTAACSPTYTGMDLSHYISSFSVGTFTHTPTYNVHDYTAQSFTVDAGSINSLTVISKGWCGVATAADFNNDGDFDDAGELLTNPTYISTDPATYVFDITIPASITSGAYRFRVFNKDANSTEGVPIGSACGAYDYGSWADYTMNVINTSGCQPPTGLTVANVLSTTADLSWTASATTPVGYIWKIVPQGDDPNLVAGITGTTITTTASAAGLTSLTAYQLYVKSDCGTDSSVWSMPAMINTTCSGIPSAGVAASNAASICPGIDFTLDLTGSAAGTGITYQWQSSPSGQNIWVDIASATTASSIINQALETDYRAIVTCAGSGLQDTSNVVSVSMNAANTCYCTPTYTNSCSGGDLIDNFILNGENATSINDLNTGCSANDYDDRTTDSVTLFVGATYPGLISSAYNSDNARIWIDFNDNGTFETTESVAEISTVGTTNKAFNIVIPATATVGTHRMRVRMVYSTSASSIDPCINYGFGETHDYTVNILIATGCIAPSNLVASDFTNDAARITWSPSTLGDPFANFNYEIRTSGAAGSGATGLSTSGTAIVDTFANVNGLIPGTVYTVYVQTNCTGSTQSGWTAGVNFTLPTYVPVAVSGFGADVIANGIGAASSSTTNDVDGVNYALVAQDFKATATGSSPTQFVPNGGNINAGLKWFKLADYSGNNSLRLSGSAQAGTLTFLAPKKASDVYVMGVSGSAASTIDAVVWFSDNTSQSFSGLSYPDWFSTTGNVVVSQVGRVNLTTDALGTGGPQLFENTLAISAANQSKQIDSIVFTTGATSAGVMNILAISIIPNYTQPCAMPSSLTASNITAQAADIAWVGNGTSTDYEISYGVAGTLAANGTIVIVPAATTHTINALNSNTPYQVFVRSVCAGNTHSDWIGPVNFQTLQVACTGMPSAGTLASLVTLACPNTPAFAITNTGATADLDITYDWFSSPAGLNTWTSLTSTGNSYSVTNQTQATDYQFVVTCTNSGLSDTAVISIGQKPSNECYCIPASATTSYNIDSFSTTGGFQNIINNGSGYSPNGYGDFTDSIVSQLLNGVIDFTANYGGGNNTFGTKIWVDWNQDGDFDDLDETVFTSSAYLSAQTGSFTVPTTATTGATRMRIGISYTPQSGPADPCSTSNSGEYEDYTFIVFAPCTDPIVDLGNDTAICEGTSLILDAGNPDLTFEWNDASTSQELTVNAAGTYSVTVTDGMCATSDTIVVTVNPLPVGTGISISDNGNGSFDFGVNGAAGVQNYNWDFGDGDIGTGPTVSHPYLQSGTFTVSVIISNDCGSDTLTTSIEAFVVGISNVDPAGNLLTLYPNPAKNNVLIESKDDMKMENVTVFNVLGQLVFEDKVVNGNSNKYQLNVSKLSSGIYTARINTNKGIVIRKFEILK